MRPHSALHRLAAIVPVIAIIPVILMAVEGFALAPTASAASPSPHDRSGNLRFEIHENDTVDFFLTMRNENAGQNLNCDTSDFDDVFDDVEANAESGDNGASCTVSFKGITLEQFNDKMPAKIDHKGESFTFEMKTSGLDNFGRVTVEAVFPGNVFEVSEHGEMSGSTATWNDVQDETKNLTAKGSDHTPPQATETKSSSSSSNEDHDTSSILLVVIITVAVAAVIGGGIIIFVVIRGKRTKAAAAPGTGWPSPSGYPQPGQQPYNPGVPQPAPGQTAPGYPDYTRPGTQPGHPQPGQQPYNPQSGQQGYNPDGPYGYTPYGRH